VGNSNYSRKSTDIRHGEQQLRDRKTPVGICRRTSGQLEVEVVGILRAGAGPDADVQELPDDVPDELLARLRFALHVRNDERDCLPPLVQLKALCGPGDNAEPVITVMLPDED
jgi:uncharacterized protein DUF6573